MSIGQPYWYGTCGYKATTSLLNRKAKQYPSHYTSSRMSRYKQDIRDKKVVCDCIGGAKGYGMDERRSGYDSLTERFHKAADRVKEIDAECARRKGQRREIETFRDAVLANDQPVMVFSNELWNATIDRMTVNLDGSVKMAFRNGMEITV